jgi:hypothetical protein
MRDAIDSRAKLPLLIGHHDGAIIERIYYCVDDAYDVSTRQSWAELRANLNDQLDNISLLRHRGCFLFQHFPDLEHLQ